MTPSLSRNNRLFLAYFVTSHGFGHAARASAVMKALLEQNSNIRFILFTQSPKWFFQDTLPNQFEYVRVQTDVGMVQQNPTREDFSASIAALHKFQIDFEAQALRLASRLARLGCKAVLCDISPLGVAAARHAKIPSILIENFTWDWIYRNYQSESAVVLKPYSDFMRAIYDTVTYHIQTQPVCEKVPADLVTPPVSRAIKTSKPEIRCLLDIPERRPMVVITMGGVAANYQFLDALEHLSDICFVIPGVSQSKVSRNNLILLPEHSRYYHPDLIHASDAVVGKVGYSTLAEVYHCGVPFGYVARPMFPESPKLTAFIQTEMTGLEFEESGFYDGTWVERVPELIKLGRIRRSKINGADQIASFIGQHV